MKARARMIIIINPTSARARLVWPTIRNALSRAGITFDVYETKHAGDATEKTRAALMEGHNIIAVVGGDGTLSEAASGFFEFKVNETQAAVPALSSIKPDAALAILPAGTGDDFARGLAGKRASLEEWLEILVAHCRPGGSPEAQQIDVIHGRATQDRRDFICLNVTTIGLGAEVAARVASQGVAMRRMPGEMRFVAAACGALASWRERHVRVTVDRGEVIESKTNLMALANGVYAGGGMMFAPQARNDDGLIDLLITEGLTRATILRELPRIRRGDHLANKRVRVIRASHVLIETFTPEDALLIEADGNVRGHTPAEFWILPKAIRILG